MDDFSFTYFLIDIAMGHSMGYAIVNYSCFRKAISKNYFQKVLLKDFISKNVSFVFFSADGFSTERVAHCSFHRAV